MKLATLAVLVVALVALQPGVQGKSKSVGGSGLGPRLHAAVAWAPGELNQRPWSSHGRLPGQESGSLGRRAAPLGFRSTAAQLTRGTLPLPLPGAVASAKDIPIDWKIQS